MGEEIICKNLFNPLEIKPNHFISENQRNLREIFFSLRLCVFAGIIFCLFGNANLNAQERKPFQDGVLYVRITSDCFLNNPSSFSGEKILGSDNAAKCKIAQVSRPFSGLGEVLDRVYKINFNQTDSCEYLLNKFRASSCIEYCERVPAFYTTFIPNDFLGGQEWYLTKIHAQQAWDLTNGDSSVVIAVVDNAVRITHGDLISKLWINKGEIPGNGIDDDGNGYIDDVNGFDVADQDGDPNPPANTSITGIFSHGTHVAGLAAAATDNHFGMSSLGFNCRLMSVKCTRDSSSGESVDDPSGGIAYAIRNGAQVINMSFTSTELSQTWSDLMDQAFRLGIVMVSATGNDSTNNYHYPAKFPHVIGVSAADSTDHICSFSDYGSQTDVVAYGNKIYSLSGGGNNAYVYMSGTSMASPQVAALAALVISENKHLSPAQVEDYIKRGCVNIDGLNPAYAGKIGAGRIDAFHTLSLVKEEMNGKTYDDNWIIFPNPSSDLLGIQVYSEDLRNAKIIIKDILGRPVSEFGFWSLNGYYNAIDVTHLPNGLYFIELISAGTTSLKKFVKR